MTTKEIDQTQMQELLHKAVHEPGLIHSAYSNFHNYSVLNSLWALIQCYGRGIEPGPISTYKGWQALGRHVRKGEKALEMWQPFTFVKHETDPETGEEVDEHVRYFRVQSRWFVLSQTAGEAIPEQMVPEWDPALAMEALGITEIAFDHMNGNALGFAREHSIAISPLNPMAHRTRFHEIAHVVLGHTKDGGEQVDGERIPYNMGEVEAESVAMIICEALGLPGAEFSRAYIQGWYGKGEDIPEAHARRIFSAANKIMQAGWVATVADQIQEAA